MTRMLCALVLLVGLPACWTPSPGPSVLDEARGPVGLVALPGSGPATDVVVMVKAGSAYDPVGQEGLSHLTAHLLREGGAEGWTPEAVDALLARLGTDISVHVDRELVTFRVRALHEDLDELAPLLGALLTRPALDPAALERIKDEAEDTLSRGVQSSDEALGEAVFFDWLWEGNPYGHAAEGRLGSLEVLDEESVRDFLAEHWVRPAVLLAVSGPAAAPGDTLDPAAPGGAALVALRDQLAAFAPRPWRDATPRAVERVEGHHALVVETGTESTGVHLGHPLRIDRGHPDWPALFLATTAFGEHRQSHGRLYRALRGARGLNYGDYAYLERYVQEGWSSTQRPGTGATQNAFSVWIRPVTADNGPFVTKAAVSMVESFVAEGLSEEELALMKAYLPARLALWGDEPVRRLAWTAEARLMGWPDPFTDLPALLSGLDASTVNQALQTHLRPDDLKIVAVTGDAEAYLQGLEAVSAPAYAGDAPDPTSEQASEDAVWAERVLSLETRAVVAADSLFQ